jgi:hypothetical protein
MRVLFKISMPVEAGNAAAKDGFKAIQSILEQQKPEAAYFLAENGKRTGKRLYDLLELPLERLRRFRRRLSRRTRGNYSAR